MGRTSKDKRDIYYRKAKELGYRARSAFKLQQLDEHFKILSSENVSNIVDLCAAPGSWSQYCARCLPDAKILAIDLQRMEPIPNVIDFKADITDDHTPDLIREHFSSGSADLVISDGAPDVTGMHDFDEYVQAQLVLASLDVATQVLRPGGTFISKVFRMHDTDLLYGQLTNLFENVTCAKPRCSRATSVEAFIVCQGYKPWVTESGFTPLIVASEKNEGLNRNKEVGKRRIVPFVSCGAVDDLDSNMSYSLSVPSQKNAGRDVYVPLAPIVQPTEPPYAEAKRRHAGRESKKAEEDKVK